jgi:formylglycine-generating enzyme required for sulfatase activity
MMAIHKKYLPMVLCAAALLAALAGCGNMVTMDELASSVTGDLASVVPKVELTQGSSPIASGGLYNFGSVVADNLAGNYVSSPVTFTVTNAGGSRSSLSVSSVSKSGTDAADFTLSSPGATTLASNASLTFTLTFDPTTSGAKTITVAVASSDAATPSYTFTVNGTGTVFSIPTVSVPAATNFSIGDTVVVTGEPAGLSTPHTVASISAFKIGTTEITYDTWAKVKHWAEAVKGYTFNTGVGTIGSSDSGSTQQPVIAMNWRDAVVWCNAASELAGLTPCYYVTPGSPNPSGTYYTDATTSTTGKISDTDTTGTAPNTNNCVLWTANGYRLPTEAEWEYGARWNGSGGNKGDRASGDTTSGAGDAAWGTYGWYSANSSGSTQPVGGKTANFLGISDMSGNASEWCWDLWVDDTTFKTETGADPHGPDSASAAGGFLNRSVRGGSYSDTPPTTPSLATSFRAFYYSDPRTYDATLHIGFRVVGGP